jgi:ubiquinone/menaquinone biosynthesis C-methylase UbiE
VLEIGPGGTPHPRSDVFLELRYSDENEWRLQRGCTERLKTDKLIVYYNGDAFPFSEGEFDYIICSHVLEHVRDVEQFLSEMFRIGLRGYIEYPTIYYEYLYNFAVHLNFLRYKGDKLLYLKKSNTHLSDFSSVQSLFYKSLEKGHVDLVNELRDFMFEGFEWNSPFPVEEAHSIPQLALDNFDVPAHCCNQCSIKSLVRSYISKIF